MNLSPRSGPSHSPTEAPAVLDVPVLIVGGGGAGLSASVFLSDLGIDSLLVERHVTTSIQPKAHILNARTMEILGHHGLAQDVYAEGSPPENCSAMAWLTSLGGEEAYDRKVLHRADVYGGGVLADRYAKASAYRHGNLGQRWLEPLIRRHAEVRNPGGVRFGHELVEFEEDREGIAATVLDRTTDRAYRVRAQYLIAADGGRTIGKRLGIRMLGTPTFLEWINLHIRSDFSEFLSFDDTVVNRVSSLADDGGLEHCGVVPMGPKRWGRHSEEWTLMFSRPPGTREAAELDDETVVKMVRRTLKLPQDHPMEVQSISRWPVEGTVAEHFRAGRAFLVGDAAHRHPPSGALGLNTGVQDSHNLAWKLAHVLAGDAAPALLDSYEAERRPVAERVVERALFSLFNQIAFTAGTGVVPGARPEWNRAQMTALFSDTADGRTRRAVLAEYFETNRITTAHLGLEMGYDYADAGFVGSDGTSRSEPDPLGLEYVQSARPGGRLPHAWLRRDGKPTATHDLLTHGAFLLIAGAKGEDWVSAVAELAGAYSPAITAHAVGPGHVLTDDDGAWAALRGHDEYGAVLVRPDGFVAMRFRSAAANPAAELRRALDVALGHAAQASAATADERRA